MSELSLNIESAPIDAARVILVLGAGGVGKTTTSIALAIRLARFGKRVGLISIDPAKRLATAIGLELGNELRPVKLPTLIHGKGSLEAAMLDQKAVFDEMVRRFAVTAKVADLIMENRLYKAASTNLGGPLEYLALAKLAVMVESKKYDVIVVDTPPDTHALDFLKRPNVLNGFMENKVMSWLLKPFLMAKRLGLTKVLSLSEKLMGGIASVTGVQALEALTEFLVLIQDVIAGFHGAGETIVKLLKSHETQFALVTVASTSALRSMEAMYEELKRESYRVGAVFMNRCLSPDLHLSLEKFSSLAAAQVLGPLPEEDDPRMIAVNGLVRRRELELSLSDKVAALVRQDSGKPTPLYRVTDLQRDLQSTEGLAQLLDELDMVFARS